MCREGKQEREGGDDAAAGPLLLCHLPKLSILIPPTHPHLQTGAHHHCLLLPSLVSSSGRRAPFHRPSPPSSPSHASPPLPSLLHTHSRQPPARAMKKGGGKGAALAATGSSASLGSMATAASIPPAANKKGKRAPAAASAAPIGPAGLIPPQAIQAATKELQMAEVRMNGEAMKQEE